MSRWRVLIVDDEPLVAETMCDVLGDHHDVASAGSVAAARQQLERAEFEVVLCDVQLPDGTAGDVRQAAAAAGRAPRFVLITGGDEHFARRLGGDAPVLRKPFDLDALPALLETLLGSRV